MVDCIQCGASNALDGKFCRSCGQALSLELMSDALAHHDELIEEGFRLFKEGRAEEAMMVAESVLDENPRSVRGLSLLGLCQENYGDLAGALATYERLLTIDPDSSLDKIKVQHLRKALTAKIQAPSNGSNRQLAFAGAGATVMFVIAVAIAIASTQRQKPNIVASNPPPKTAPDLATFDPSNFPSQQTGVPPRVNADPSPGAVEAPAEQEAPSTENPTRVSDPQPLTGNIAQGTEPVKINVVPERQTGDDSSGPDEAAVKKPNDPEPEPTKPAKDEQAKPPADDPGVIEISVRRDLQPTTTSGGGSISKSTEQSGTELQVVLKAATEQFQLGRYENAAKGFEKALQAGGDAGRLNQRLGQCYEKLGRKDDAIRCYQRAASAYDAALRAGAGDPDKLQRALDSCRQALKVLGA